MTTPTPTHTTWADALAAAIEKLDAKPALPVMTILYVLRKLLNFTEGAFGDARARYERMDGALKHLASMTARLPAASWVSVAQQELQQFLLGDVADAVRQYVEDAALPDGLLAGHDLADLIQDDDLAGFQAAVAEALK